MKNNGLFRRGVLPLLLGLAATTAQAATVLEEVIVTATLRAESLQDVPVSVNAVSGEKLIEAGIDKIEDLQAYVPNLTMSETGIGTNIYIRGIGSGINQGFEQSVGMYFDGVSYGRAQLSRAPFLDLARVEVLRGPQNILFGKNSIAGALSLHSQRPGQEFEGSVSGLYEPGHGESVLDLILSGPLTDRLGARLAVRQRDMDGYIENLTLDTDEPERDETTVRLLLDWAATDNLQALFKFEVGSFDVTGRQVEIINDQPSNHPVFGSTSSGPDQDGDGRRDYSEILFNTSVPPFVNIRSDASVLNNELDFKRSSNGDFSKNDTGNFTMNLDYLWGEHTVTSITAYMTYEYDEICDCDFTGAEVFKVALAEDYDQVSQEFRIASPVGGFVEYIAGVFYQKSELDFFDSILTTSDVLPGLVNLGDAVTTPLPGGLGRRQDGGGDAGNELRFLGTPRNFVTDTELYSAFLQLTFSLTDTLRLTVGGRYSTETKEGARKLDFSDIRTGERRPNGEVDSVVAINFKAERHDLEGERDESNFAPSVNLQWDINDNMMGYATWSRGFKSGGFDARSNASPAANNPDPGNADPSSELVPLIGTFEYDEEQAESIELGLKSTLLDGAAELNIAAFYTEFDDLQISIFDGTLGFNVGNAGAAETFGIELDGRMALSERLMLTGALAFLDFEFTDFQNGQCNHVQVRNGEDPDGDGLCDFTGMTNQYVADFSGNIGLVYTQPIGDSLELRSGLDVVFTDDYNPTQNLDPTQEQDGYAVLNGRLALADFNKGWEIALVGKNLTDEEIVTYANDTPLANSVFGSVNHYGFIARPRSVALQAAYRWY